MTTGTPSAGPGPVVGTRPAADEATGASPGVTGRSAPPPWSPAATWAVRAVGAAAAVSLAVTVWLGLWVTPPDVTLGQYVRLVYIHPAVAWVALYLAFGIGAAASLLWLWPRTRSRFWDRLAASSLEIATVYTGLLLVTGSIWGRTTWGVWWAWDARLTFSALLFVLLLGYLALRRIPGDPDQRARRSAIGALVAAVDVPIIHFSVNWWATLHQTASILVPSGPTHIHGIMAWTVLIGFVAFSLVYVWLLAVRVRIETLNEQLEGADLEQALVERWSEDGGDR